MEVIRNTADKDGCEYTKHIYGHRDAKVVTIPWREYRRPEGWWEQMSELETGRSGRASRRTGHLGRDLKGVRGP